MGGMRIAEAMERTGLSRRRLQRWAMRLGYRPYGRDYHLTKAQVERVRVAAERGRAAYQRRAGQA